MTTLIQNNIWLLIVSIVWVLPWKGYALWTASRNSNKIWFIVILIINTFGILEIFYLFYVAKKTPRDILNSFKKNKTV